MASIESDLRAASTTLERLSGEALEASRLVGGAPAVLGRADPGEVARRLQEAADSLLDVAELLDVLRFGGPDPLSGSSPLPIGD